MQITRSQFKNLILLQVLLLVCYVGASFFTTALLPLTLQDYLNTTMEQNLSVLDILTVIIALPFFVWALQNLSALYNFRSYAPRHLLYITLLSTIFYINLAQPIVYTNIDAFLNDTLFLLNGITIALVFCSNLAAEFKKSEPAQTLST